MFFTDAKSALIHASRVAAQRGVDVYIYHYLVADNCYRWFVTERNTDKHDLMTWKTPDEGRFYLQCNHIHA